VEAEESFEGLARRRVGVLTGVREASAARQVRDDEDLSYVLPSIGPGGSEWFHRPDGASGSTKCVEHHAVCLRKGTVAREVDALGVALGGRSPEGLEGQAGGCGEKWR